MPHTKSAKKRLRQNEARRLHNRAVRSELRTTIRKFNEAVEAGDPAKADETLQLAYKKLDKCAARNYIHRNVADRTKSRLTKRRNGLDG